jgi:hypothetical protein
MSDASSHRVADCLEEVHAELRSHGYALTSDQAIGLPKGFRENLSQNYYNSDTLHQDAGDIPVDRERARDVMRYGWSDAVLSLEPFDRITITDRAGIPGEREHSRVHLHKDLEAEKLIRTFLQLVPPERRQADGTFGINLFRTYTNVVTTPHHDYEEFLIFYIVDRIGDGAETRLYRPEDIAEGGTVLAEPVLTHQLNPGEIIIFEDKVFKHDTTSLIGPPGGTARRDALICTVDYRDTYLARL